MGEETVTALMAAASALFGALVGGTASVAGSYLAARATEKAASDHRIAEANKAELARKAELEDRLAEKEAEHGREQIEVARRVLSNIEAACTIAQARKNENRWSDMIVKLEEANSECVVLRGEVLRMHVELITTAMEWIARDHSELTELGFEARIGTRDVRSAARNALGSVVRGEPLPSLSQGILNANRDYTRWSDTLDIMIGIKRDAAAPGPLEEYLSSLDQPLAQVEPLEVAEPLDAPPNAAPPPKPLQ